MKLFGTTTHLLNSNNDRTSMGADLPLMLRASSVVTAQGFEIEVVVCPLVFAVLDETDQYFSL